MRELSSRGIRVVLATSAPEDELKMPMDVLDAEDAIHATTNADDVATAKPEPGIIEVALERAGADPSDALFVGDSIWDMMAAARAHVRSAVCCPAASDPPSCWRPARSPFSTTRPTCSTGSTGC
ncbi:HAD family hydrolase [Leifsonia sp. L25]|uniref:HAD family hydrolase n=1 Tax=Leifsonia sp. L25 TaxID=3423957 RepID=UPI003D69AF00